MSAEPSAEENLIGYIVRLTELNDYDTPSWILQLSGIKNYLHSKCNFVCDNSIDLSRLAQLTGISINRLSLLRYTRISYESLGEGYLMHDAAVPQYLIRINKPKLCLNASPSWAMLEGCGILPQSLLALYTGVCL